MDFRTTSTRIPLTSICSTLVLTLSLHDLEDFVDGCPVGGAVEDLFDRDSDLLLLELVPAPVVALGFPNRLVELHRELGVAAEVVVECTLRSRSDLGWIGGVGAGLLDLLGELDELPQVVLVVGRLALALL